MTWGQAKHPERGLCEQRLWVRPWPRSSPDHFKLFGLVLGVQEIGSPESRGHSIATFILCLPFPAQETGLAILCHTAPEGDLDSFPSSASTCHMILRK